MRIVRFDVNDKLCMKKKHPCGSDVLTVLRTGSDIRVVCDGCGRDITLPRTTLEKNIKRVIPNESDGN